MPEIERPLPQMPNMMKIERANTEASLAHTNNFDAIRIAAALAVLVSHHHALTGQFEPLVLGIHSLGGFAVLVFFVISGYLVTASWCNDPHLLRFVVRRTLRVWPAYIVLIALTAYALGALMTNLPIGEYLHHSETSGYLSNIWFQGKASLPGVFEHNPLRSATNGSIWTIPYEVQCYAILACAGFLGLLRIRIAWLLAILATVIWYQIKWGPDFHSNWQLRKEMMAYFLIGSALFILRPHWKKRSWLWLILLLGVGLYAWFSGLRYLAFLMTVPFLIISFGTGSTPLLNKFGRWGDPSYGIYLMAFPIQQTIIQFLWPSTGFFTTLILSILITTSIAYASWHTIEKKILKIKPHKP